MKSVFRPEFKQALRLLAKAVDGVVAKGYLPPILVGGGAVEYHTGGHVVSGDFDLTTPHMDVLEHELLSLGFEKPSGAGVILRGWVHPDLLIGVEVVSSVPFEGRSDRERIILVDVEGSQIAVIPVEDIIADRMGQYVSSPQLVPEMLQQAITLYQLAWDADEEYLEKRIREETLGELGLVDLKRALDETDDT